MLVDQDPEARLLPVIERAARADGTAGTLSGQGVWALLGIGPPPPRDGLPGDAQDVGHGGLGVALLDGVQRRRRKAWRVSSDNWRVSHRVMAMVGSLDGPAS